MALGLATPLASAALIGTMLTAIQRVHLKNGPWVTKGGYEYNVVLIAAALWAWGIILMRQIARMAGASPDVQIIPFRGEYYMIRREREGK